MYIHAMLDLQGQDMKQQFLQLFLINWVSTSACLINGAVVQLKNYLDYKIQVSKYYAGMAIDSHLLHA